MRRVNLKEQYEIEWDHGQMREGYRWRAATIGKQLKSARIGASVYDLNEGERTYPFHAHHGTEEWLIVLEGTPTVRQKGDWVPPVFGGVTREKGLPRLLGRNLARLR